MVINQPMASSAALDTAWAGLIGACLLYAILCDVSVRLIPNRVSLGLAALAIPLRLARDQMTESLLVAALILLVLGGLRALRLIGGGDVKLWAACSLLVPPHFAAQGAFSLHVVLIGGVLALAYLALRLLVHVFPTAHAGTAPSGRAGRHSVIWLHPLVWLGRVWRAERWRARRRGSIPYGVAIAAASWFAYWPSVLR